MAKELEQTAATGAAHADTLFGWSQSDVATKLHLAGCDMSRSGMSKIEVRLSYVYEDEALSR